MLTCTYCVPVAVAADVAVCCSKEAHHVRVSQSKKVTCSALCVYQGHVRCVYTGTALITRFHCLAKRSSFVAPQMLPPQHAWTLSLIFGSPGLLCLIVYDGVQVL
jgi:hypothetical protein